MSAPAPGSAPTVVPSRLPRRMDAGYLTVKPHMPANTLPILLCTTFIFWPALIAYRSTSDTRKAGRITHADTGDHQAQKQGHKAFDWTAGGNENRTGKAEQHEPEIFE